MTYVEEARRRLLSELPELEGDEGLLDLYAVLVFTRGWRVTPEDVHDAWALWASRKNPGHPSIVPFCELDEAVQGLDEPFADAIATVAASMREFLEGRYGE